jgi:hypothetical protein
MNEGECWNPFPRNEAKVSSAVAANTPPSAAVRSPRCAQDHEGSARQRRDRGPGLGRDRLHLPQWLQTRIKRLEGELDRQRDYQRRNYELFVTAYRKIWTGLVDIEHWLRHNLWADIQSSPSLDPERWTIFYDTYKSFRGEMLFLPDSLYTRTQQLIRDVERNLNVLIDVLRDVIVARNGSRKATPPTRSSGASQRGARR